MDTSAEKLIKQTIKLISKTQDLDYEDLKHDAKKLIRAARTYDENMLGIMEEIMDLGNVGSQEEINDFSIEVLRIFCRIKDLDESGSDKSVRSRVWACIEEEFELDTDDDNDEVSIVESDEEDPEPEPEPEPVPEPEQEIVVKKVKRVKKPVPVEKEVIIIG
jgi:hypothetical protein